MLRMPSWLGDRHKGNASTHSLNSIDEPQYLEDAMRAVTHIMNEDVEAAEAGLAKGNSAFHKLGKGVVTFLRAALGFEQEVMREASERLADAEATASNDHRRAQKEPRAYHSSIYPDGSEFALVHAECQIMSAVVGVLNESLTESIRGFYKLRKAYQTLDAILDAENKYMKAQRGSLDDSSRTSLDSGRGMPGTFNTETYQTSESNNRPGTASRTNEVKQPGDNDAQDQTEGDDDTDDFYDADEDHTNSPTTSRYLGHIDTSTAEKGMKDISLENRPKTGGTDSPTRLVLSNHTTIDHDPDSQFFANSIDMFVHSGSNLCFGLLLLLISLIPPAFGKLLYIIGFRGDRERGIKLLWQASKFPNINGGMAGLVLLGYYNGFMGFCDILPDEDDESLEGYPKQRCGALLAEMRSRYPKSKLWKVENARMEAMNRNLPESVKILSEDVHSPLKQVEALAIFEKSLVAMYAHRHSLTAESFLKCITLNNWSHGLYYYIAGASHIELYRRELGKDTEKAKFHARKAAELLLEAPNHTGKKKLMARQLPLDVFVSRKIQKWQSRAQEWGIGFVDAVGVSPIEEMQYFWNGYKRMTPLDLQESLDALSWSDTTNPHWHREALDERAIHAFLLAVTKRNLGQYSEARQILKDEIIRYDRNLFKGNLKDDWTCPAAHYEMAVICWMEKSKSNDEAAKVRECADWLDKASKWERYGLDARVGVKITTAQDTLQRYHEQRQQQRSATV
ncbi:MAG: hypothetical protein M4579_001055 [Chaenotheca gracillima]|nr:MAG: hypothetical protein M4579_001055 [Chaenotheca gracillima]